MLHIFNHLTHTAFSSRPVILCQPTDNDLTTRIMNALALYHMSDFTIVLTQAEKLRPGMVDFITTYSKRLS